MDKKYYDVIAQAESGLMSLTGTPDKAMKIGSSVVDAFSGMSLAFAIASALFYREKTHQGQYIDVSMLGCSMNLLESNLIEYSLTKVNPIRTGNKDNLISPFGMYKAQDGCIVIAVGNNSLWRILLEFLKEYVAVVNDTLFATNALRLEHNVELTSMIEKVFSSFTVVALQEKLTQRNIPCSKVNEMSDVYSDVQNYRQGYLSRFHHPDLGECVVPGKSITFSKFPENQLQSAPSIGQHNIDYGL